MTNTTNNTHKTRTTAQANRAADIASRWWNSDTVTIGEAYTTASVLKWRAERQIKDEMSANNGTGYAVTGWNTWQFSCAYICPDVDPATGAVEPFIIYHTADNRRVYNLAEILANCDEAHRPEMFLIYAAAREWSHII